jgi:aldehyde dehydrogenase (NAD+)
MTGTVTRLRATFATGRTRDVAWRLQQLDALERLLVECEDVIAEALAEDLGRPRIDAFMGDIMPPLAEVKFAKKHLKRWVRPQRVSLPLAQLPGRGWYEYEPLGVVLIIAPWNYPFYLALGPLVGAIAAGNCAVLKPSEITPACAKVLADLLPRYLDPEAFAVIEGGPDITQDLLAQGMDHVFFTGSPEVGKAVMAGAAPHLTPVTLELGGKSPVLVAADADLEVTARRIAWTKLLNSGQTCLAPDYVLVERPVRDRFVALLKESITELSPQGDGAMRMPIVTPRHAHRLVQLLADHGGEVVHGGESAPEDRAVDLTVVVDPDTDSRIMQEEIFGPLLPIVTVDSPDEAIEFINRREKPLAAYVFSRSKELQRRFGRRVPAGSVVVNHAAVQVLVPNLPFGGVGNSGMGAYHGKWGFETFSHRKAHLSRAVRPDLRMVYPPYGKLTERIIRRIF